MSGGNPEAYVRQALYTTYLSWRRRRWRFEVPTAELPEHGSGDHARELAGMGVDNERVTRTGAMPSYNGVGAFRQVCQ